MNAVTAAITRSSSAITSAAVWPRVQVIATRYSDGSRNGVSWMSTVDASSLSITSRRCSRADGLPAITKVSVLDRAGAYALVRCDLVTGRPVDELMGRADVLRTLVDPQSATPRLSVIVWGLPNSQEIAFHRGGIPRAVRAVFTGVVVAMVILLNNAGTPSPFLYFNF